MSKEVKEYRNKIINMLRNEYPLAELYNNEPHTCKPCDYIIECKINNKECDIKQLIIFFN